MPIRRTRPSGRPYNRSWRANGAATHVGGAAAVTSPAHWAACTGGAPTGAKRLAAAPRRARRLRRLPAGLSLSAWADRRSIPASEPADRRCRVDSGGRRPALPYSTFRADTSPIMVDRSGRAPRRQSRRGSVSGAELDCASRGKSNGPETSERAAGLAKSAPTCTRRHIPIQTERRPKRGEHARRRGSSRGAVPDQTPPEATA